MQEPRCYFPSFTGLLVDSVRYFKCTPCNNNMILLSTVVHYIFFSIPAFTCYCYSLCPHTSTICLTYNVHHNITLSTALPKYGNGIQQLLRVYTDVDSCLCMLRHCFYIFMCWAWSSSTWKGIQTLLSLPSIIIIIILIVMEYLFNMLGFSIFLAWYFSWPLTGKYLPNFVSHF